MVHHRSRVSVVLKQELGSAVPAKVGVVSKVILSVLDAPVSEPVVRSGTDGTSGSGMVSLCHGTHALQTDILAKSWGTAIWEDAGHGGSGHGEPNG